MIKCLIDLRVTELKYFLIKSTYRIHRKYLKSVTENVIREYFFYASILIFRVKVFLSKY